MAELMAVFISRQLKDGEVIGGGGGAQLIPRAGQLLAHLSHGPNMKLHLLIRTNLSDQSSLSLSFFDSLADWRQSRWAEAYWTPSEIYDELKLFRKRVFFMNGIQIDKYGNINLFGVGKDFNKLDFRGPGGFGTATAGTYVDRYYLYATRHNQRIFVDHCNYITCFGWGKGGSDARSKLGLPGGGPVGCLTPLGFMDFDEETKKMRLKSLHPGVAVDQVISNTGFKLIIPQRIPETEPPTEEEISMLRTRIDPEGLLQKLNT
jgi:glutaconate CoA-transferase subunit B